MKSEIGLPPLYDALENASHELREKYIFMSKFVTQCYMEGVELGPGNRFEVARKLHVMCNSLFIKHFLLEKHRENNLLWQMVM